MSTPANPVSARLAGADQKNRPSSVWHALVAGRERLPAHDFICSWGFFCPPVSTQEHLAEKKKKQIQVPRHRRRAWQKPTSHFYLFIYFTRKSGLVPPTLSCETKLWNWDNNNSNRFLRPHFTYWPCLTVSTTGRPPRPSSMKPPGCRVSYVVLIITLVRAMEALQLRPPDRAAGPVARVGLNGHQSHP